MDRNLLKLEISKVIVDLDLSMLKENPYNFFDSLSVKDPDKYESLKEDISINGIINPLVFKFREGVNYIIQGHDRYRIAKELGFEKVPCREVISEISLDEEMAILNGDNLNRKTPSPDERKEMYAKILGSDMFSKKKRGVNKAKYLSSVTFIKEGTIKRDLAEMAKAACNGKVKSSSELTENTDSQKKELEIIENVTRLEPVPSEEKIDEPLKKEECDMDVVFEKIPGKDIKVICDALGYDIKKDKELIEDFYTYYRGKKYIHEIEIKYFYQERFNKKMEIITENALYCEDVPISKYDFKDPEKHWYGDHKFLEYLKCEIKMDEVVSIKKDNKIVFSQYEENNGYYINQNGIVINPSIVYESKGYMLEKANFKNGEIAYSCRYYSTTISSPNPMMYVDRSKDVMLALQLGFKNILPEIYKKTYITKKDKVLQLIKFLKSEAGFEKEMPDRFFLKLLVTGSVKDAYDEILLEKEKEEKVLKKQLNSLSKEFKSVYGYYSNVDSLELFGT
ncbi:MAG: ParB N-terminal domain-containing protein [Leptospiraceae bacterium]|nr:ParB N-terminal domain-containing protein [Leptospiraceae bacterium]MCP5501912.1 ParB N-terminal domain-containing protein [Leptospiraceae bacterium]